MYWMFLYSHWYYCIICFCWGSLMKVQRSPEFSARVSFPKLQTGFQRRVNQPRQCYHEGGVSMQSWAGAPKIHRSGFHSGSFRHAKAAEPWTTTICVSERLWKWKCPKVAPVLNVLACQTEVMLAASRTRWTSGISFIVNKFQTPFNLKLMSL